MLEKRSSGSNTKYNSSLRGTTSRGPSKTKDNFSVSMVSTRSSTENKTREDAKDKQVEPTIEIDLETPDQSVDEVEKKTTESTPMPHMEGQISKTVEFSPIDALEDTTGNTRETVKDDSQVKKTSFTEKLAKMVGIKSKDNTAEESQTERARTFGTLSTKATEADLKEEQARTEEAAENKTTADHETAALELGDLMTKLYQIDKKLKYSEEDRDLIRKELKYNKHEYLDSYFNLAKATDERLQQMSEKVEATNEERDKNIKKDMQQLKNRYDDVNSQLGSLEKRMDIMNRNQAESSCAIQAKLDAILRNSTSQERPAADRTQGTRVDFVEPQRNKRQSTADLKEEQARTEEAAENKTTADHETAALELGDLMTKLYQIDKKLKYSEEDKDLIRKELKYNKHEYLDSYFNLAKAADERLQQMSEKVEATNEERDKNIKKDMQQLKNRYDDVNSQLGSLEKRMDIMNRNQAESSCAIQAKLDAILRNSTSQERPAADRTQGTRVDFVEPQRNKRQSTADLKEEQARTEEAAENKTTADHETAALELGDLMTKLYQIDKKLKYSEEDRDLIRKELKYNKHEYLDSYFNLAKATDERLQQMSEKVEATNEERDKNIKKDMQQLKNRYDDVNSQLGSLEKRMDIMNRNQAESSCAIQAKLDAILRNSTSQERPAADRTQGTRVDFVEPQRNKRLRKK